MRSYRSALENIRKAPEPIEPVLEPPRPTGFMPSIMGMQQPEQASLPVDPNLVVQKTFQSINQAKSRYEEKLKKIRQEQYNTSSPASSAASGFMQRRRQQEQENAQEQEAYSPLDALSQRETSAPQARGGQATNTEFVTYRNQAAVRNLPASDSLLSSLSFLADMGVRMEVISGGQPPAGSSESRFNRIGSTRHDDGNAVDVDLYMGDRKLDWNNPSDLPILQEIVTTARRNGVTGIGAGNDYMGPGRFHFGFGPTAVWGAGGSRDRAPSWLVEAFEAGGR